MAGPFLTEAGRMPGPPPLALRLFGPFEVLLNGRPFPRLRTRKGYHLLSLLALRHGREVERAWVAGTLWPDSPEPLAAMSLRACLRDLRRALRPEDSRLRSPSRRSLTLDLVEAEVDLVAFDAALARGDEPSLEAAVALYRGPLLEGWDEEWLFEERRQREQAYLAALERLAAAARKQGDPAGAVAWLRRAVEVDPLRESAQRAVMEALAASGSYAAALQLYRDLRLRLHHELNTEPDAETRQLFEQIRAEARRRAQSPPPVRGRDASAASAPTGALTLAGEGMMTFLFTDIEGSTKLWEEHTETMREALARHDQLLGTAIEGLGGKVFKTVGDQFCAAFVTAPDALAAALAAQRALAAAPWPQTGESSPGSPLRVRMALYTGVAQERDGDFFGPPLNRVARLLEAAHGGQVLLSLGTQEMLCDALPEEVSLRDLGLHRLRDLSRAERIFEVVAPDLPGEFPPLRTLNRRPHNLPVQPGPLIGRERELEAVKRLMREPAVRLVTLTGPGGSGKTRLSAQVAADLVESFADGIFFVDLAPIREPALVIPTIAHTLDVRESGSSGLLSSLQRFLREKQILLVLDNFEQVLEAAPQLTELLASSAGLKLLVTSRAVLNLRGEHEFSVPPLDLPELSRGARFEKEFAAALTQFSAVQLFVARAVTARSQFSVTNENAPAVAEICHRLDGLPLAIELAASRIRVLSPQALLARLEKRLPLLVGGARDLPERQRTLRNTIAWSYDLLQEEEQRLFRRLSTFAGGFTVEAAEAVCSIQDGIADDILGGISSLAEKSLLRQDEQEGEPRFGMLETIREFAYERLQESGEAEALGQRHRDWCLALAEQAEPELHGPEQVTWFARLEQEHDNLRAALGWSAAHGQANDGLRMGAALWFFWEVRGHYVEGREQLIRLLALPEAQARTAARARALYAAGWLDKGWGETARARLKESLAIAREVNYRPTIADALNCLGFLTRSRNLLEESLAVAREIGDRLRIAEALRRLGRISVEAARPLHEESLVLHRQLGNKYGIASSLSGLWSVAFNQGDFEAALVLGEEDLAIRRELGDRWGIARSLLGLGRAHLGLGNFGAARALVEQGLVITREVGDNPYEYSVDSALLALGSVAHAQGDYQAARLHYQESLTIRWQYGGKPDLVEPLEGLALALAQGEPERAAHLLGAAEALREAIRAPMRPASRVEHDRSVATLRAVLGAAAFEAAWAEGRSMSIEAVVRYALEEPGGPEPVGEARGAAAVTGQGADYPV